MPAVKQPRFVYTSDSLNPRFVESARKLQPLRLYRDWAEFQPSKSGNKPYQTSLDSCSCSWYRKRGSPCKHMIAFAMAKGVYHDAASVDTSCSAEPTDAPSAPVLPPVMLHGKVTTEEDLMEFVQQGDIVQVTLYVRTLARLMRHKRLALKEIPAAHLAFASFLVRVDGDIVSPADKHAKLYRRVFNRYVNRISPLLVDHLADDAFSLLVLSNIPWKSEDAPGPEPSKSKPSHPKPPILTPAQAPMPRKCRCTGCGKVVDSDFAFLRYQCPECGCSVYEAI